MSQLDQPGQESRFYDNIVTVAKTRYHNQILTKEIHPDRIVKYGNVKHFNLIPQEVFDLNELYKLLARAIANPRVCLLRAVPIADDRQPVVNVQRIAVANSVHGPQTLIPRPSNVVILDVDNYGKASGNVERDARRVLLALDMLSARCIAIASASYCNQLSDKKGICLRMFFWNSEQVTNRDLKRYFANHSRFVDPALFSPGQPIYVATPVFVDCADPVAQRMVEVNSEGTLTDIPHSDEMVGYSRSGYAYQYDYYTQADAKRVARTWWQKIAITEYQGTPGRHTVLFEASCIFGKFVGLGLLTEDEAYEVLTDACDQWGSDHRNTEKDIATIRDGLKRGQREINEGGAF